MEFSNPVFLFIFLPIVIVLYLLLDRRFRSYYLLCASLVFYAWGETVYILFLLMSIVFNYIFSILIDRFRLNKISKVLISITIIFNIGLLVFLKSQTSHSWLLHQVSYFTKLDLSQFQSMHVPIGISFFTFQAIAYVVDIYTEKSKIQRNPFAFALFMSFFPKIASGPIIRYQEVENDICDPQISVNNFVVGVSRFIVGLGKKVLIADVLSRTTDPIFSIPSGEITASLAWIGVVCYTLQIYFDFSGYSDMAIGLARIFGFQFAENFNYPYISRSVTEFWRRWHISLSSWLRDYLFFPLNYALITDKVRLKMQQGQYRIPYRTLYSLFIVFTLCGLWHGTTVNFVIWGMIHGFILVIESVFLGKVLKRTFAPLAHVYTLTIIMMSWVFFRTATLTDSFLYLKALFGMSSSSGLRYNSKMFINNELILTLIVGVIGAYPIVDKLNLKRLSSDGWPSTNVFTKVTLTVAEISCFAAILILSMMAMANTTHKPFIYFSFQ